MEAPVDCPAGEEYRCRLDDEGKCGPGSGCLFAPYCHPSECNGECEWACDLGWDCSPSAETSILLCISDPNDEGCDVWEQDCAVDQKCSPLADDGGDLWSDTRCVPVVPQAKELGEPCEFPGSPSEGDDNCDFGLVCWNVDDETNLGTCKAFCDYFQGEPRCSEGYVCSYFEASIGVALCIDRCDPLAQDCASNEACLPTSALDGDGWMCFLDASGDDGQFGDPCELVASCDPGLLCVLSELVPECEGTACCSPLCDITAPNTCPGEGQECFPRFEGPGLENVGICRLPW